MKWFPPAFHSYISHLQAVGIPDKESYTSQTATSNRDVKQMVLPPLVPLNCARGLSERFWPAKSLGVEYGQRKWSNCSSVHVKSTRTSYYTQSEREGRDIDVGTEDLCGKRKGEPSKTEEDKTTPNIWW